MLDVGYWHGSFATSYDGARAEAAQHQQDAPDHNAGVLRRSVSSRRSTR
jgi:hypothetical protein